MDLATLFALCNANDVDGLLHAVKTETDEDALQRLLDVNDESSEYRLTPVTTCCMNGYTALLEVLLLRGADVNKVAIGGRCPALFAAGQGHVDCLRTLIAHGAALDLPTEKGDTAMHRAVDNGQYACLEELLKGGASLDRLDGEGRTAQFIAAMHGLERFLQLMLAHGADPNATGHGEGLTPGLVASQNGRDRCLRLLISAGGSLAAITMHGKSALQLAAQVDHAVCVEVLLQAGMDVDGCSRDGQTALHLAASSNAKSCVDVLLSHGASTLAGPQRIDGSIITPLEAAVASQFKEVAELISRHVDKRDSDAVYNLKVASLRGSLADIHRHAASVADVDHYDEQFHYMTPLMLAALYNKPEAVRALISHGAKVNFFADAGASNFWTAAIHAAAAGSLECLHILRDHGADLNKSSSVFNDTPLGVAAKNGRVQTIRFLMSCAGVEAAKENKGNQTPLALYLKSPSVISRDLVLDMLEADMPVEVESGSPRRGHSHSWTLLVDCTNESVSEDLCMDVVSTIMTRHPCIAVPLAFTTDAHGRVALNITHSSVRTFINSRIFFCGRYEIQQGAAAHKSATAVVHFATDRALNLVPPARVALKFMAHADQFEREQTLRASSALDEAMVVSILRSHCVTTDELYESSAARIGLSAYPYCLVMPAADRSLKGVIDSEHIAGRDWPAIKVIAEQLVRCVAHVHDRGLVHGDIKPLNVMRVGAHIKLIDLDAAASFVSNPPQWAASKSSSAFLPPELLHRDAASGAVGVRASSSSSSSNVGGFADVPYDLVAAHPSQDMWGLGCVLYHLFAGEPLFLSNTEDNLTEPGDLLRLLEWAFHLGAKEQRLSRITNDSARYLASQLLSANPSLRPSAETVLAHPFFTGRQVGRMAGQEALFDVFLSYRVDSDASLARTLFDKLSARHVRVWLDVKCLKDGVGWEEGFCNGLVQSRCLLPILSKKAIKARFEALTEDSACDNVLLEYRLAGELHQRGMIERIFPLFVGELDDGGSYGNYFAQGCAPAPASAATVAAVEAKLRMHLDRQGLGLPLQPAASVKAVLGEITAKQGGFIEGIMSLEATLDALADRVAAMVKEAGSTPAAPDSNAAAAPAAAAGATKRQGAEWQGVNEWSGFAKTERPRGWEPQNPKEAFGRIDELEARMGALR